MATPEPTGKDSNSRSEERKPSTYARSLLEASLDPLVTISPEGRITDVNEATVRATGVSRQALVGSRFSDYFTEPDRAEAGYRLVLAEGQVRHYPLTLRHVSGQTMDVLYNATTYRDESGTVQGVFAAARDVTWRKRAEESIQRLQRAVEQAANVIFMTDPEGAITYVNPAFEKTYGYSREEALGKTPRILKSGRHGPSFYEEFWQKLLAGEPVRREFVNKRRDGQLVTIEQSVTPVLATDGKRVGFIAVQNDITERKRAEEALRRLNAELEERVRVRTAELEAVNKELEAFAYSVSHDLRAPLRAISGFSEILREDYGGRLDAEGNRAIARIVAGTQAMGRLIDDLLKLSRLTRKELRRERVDLSEIVRDVAAEERRREPDRKVEVVVAESAPVEGDPELLRVAMENLLGNAFKFTAKKDQARVEFGVDRNGQAPVYFVRDNGAGFDPAYAGRLFGAFQRLHAEAEFPGTGIGLATVQRVFLRHGGRAWAEGQVGRGATFYFTLGKERP